MATSVKRIEKEFLMKVLFDEQLPLIFLKDQTEYSFTLEKNPKGGITLHQVTSEPEAESDISTGLKIGQRSGQKTRGFLPEKPVSKLKQGAKIDLLFDYRGQVINFSVEINYIKDGVIYCDVPEILYKNLDRSYSRVDSPQDFEVQFAFLGDRYNLSFPKIMEYEAEEAGKFLKDYDLHNLSGVIDQMAEWVKKYTSGYKMVIFKDVKPESVEERIVTETGKTLYLPTTLGYFPLTDPYPKKRLITEEMFKRYLESTGVSLTFINDACARFIQGKNEDNIFSDAWIPILFHEYVIGYVHIWVENESGPPIDYHILDTVYEFTKVLSNSLKINGYFDKGKLPNEPFGGKIIDISASGLLFSYPTSNLSQSLFIDSELMVTITSPNRTVNAKARIVRRIKDKNNIYFGCQFLDMFPEDMRFLFERIYGKPFTDVDANFLTGQV